MAKASAPKAAAKTKTETMSTRQLAAQLAEHHELTNKAANAIMEDFAAIVTKQLKKGVRIRLNEQLARLVPIATIGGIASSGKRCHFRRL